ncbi:MAG: hypothetical protein WC712_03355 [Candidatus Brocadiia bacterium]
MRACKATQEGHTGSNPSAVSAISPVSIASGAGAAMQSLFADTLDSELGSGALTGCGRLWLVGMRSGDAT